MKKLKYSLIVFFLSCAYCLTGFTDDGKKYEDYYNKKWCGNQNGVAEKRLYEPYTKEIGDLANRDRWLVGRVDCVTDEYAVETEWSYKWKESIGQTIMYAELTGKKPAILLIMSGDEVDDYRNLTRLETTLRHLRFKGNIPIKVFYITTDY